MNVFLPPMPVFLEYVSVILNSLPDSLPNFPLAGGFTGSGHGQETLSLFPLSEDDDLSSRMWLLKIR